MRIVVTEVGRSFGGQTRAYAEYRIFSSLVRFSDVVREADIRLTPQAADGCTAGCRVSVTVEGGHCLCVSGLGAHVYGAIDQATQRLGDALRRHTGPA
jgi:ribosome-associated translation inhibitor RaiA